MKISLAPARMAPRISISNWLATAPSMRPGTVSSQLSAEAILVMGMSYQVRLVDLTVRAAARQLLKIIQHVDHLPEPAVVAPIESESNPGQVHHIGVFMFFRRRCDDADFVPHHNVGEILVQRVERRPRWRVVQPDDEQVFDEPHRM